MDIHCCPLYVKPKPDEPETNRFLIVPRRAWERYVLIVEFLGAASLSQPSALFLNSIALRLISSMDKSSSNVYRHFV